ncbi:trans-sialidase [Trypanosoma cruzi]|nr:trans-sialidase [Trypanosoma cruzi]
MLSRVAAVKAPRTHNRRRVTGSSGRRREGRESEPQRPNMSRLVFASAVLPSFFLFVTLRCGNCGATPAKENDGKNDLRSVQEPERVDLFFHRRRCCSRGMRLFQVRRGIHLFYPFSSVLVEWWLLLPRVTWMPNVKVVN